MYVGHDTNLGALSALLDLHWLEPGGTPNDTPPGGGLIFEERGLGADASVRVFFAAQTLDEMRNLSADAGLHRVPISIPGCATDCPLATFDAYVRGRIDPGFTSP